MSVQDDLLSFQIKETIFLSSDKANIGEMKELELIPDVEIIENNNEISITGCLQLHGRYEPVHNVQASQTGEPDSLLEAMKFTPFQLQDEEAKRFLYAQDAELVHRIPLNVSIPISRIEELNEIYAIVDSFDYEVKTPHQLQIQADLKISGIQLKSQEAKPAEPTLAAESITPAASILQPEGTERESWEFVHLANSPEEDNPTTSFEELEHKLAKLEREVETREQPYQALQQPPAPFTPLPYPPSAPYSPPPYAQAPYSPSPYVGEHAQSQAFAKPSFPWIYNSPQATQPTSRQVEPVTDVPGSFVGYPQGRENVNYYQQPFEPLSSIQTPEYKPDLEVGSVEAPPQEAVKETANQASEEPAVETQAVPEHIEANNREQEQLVDYPMAYEEQQFEQQEEPFDELGEPDSDPADTDDTLEAEEADAQPEERAEDAVETTVQAEEVKEMKVAIGSKPSAEKESGLNITSLFTQAGRPRQEQAAEERYRDSSGTSASREIDETVRAQASELRSSLSSFVRESDQQFSRLKMCIIQKEDTIQSIADRYELPVSKLLEVNRLSTDRITKGQVLYIPQ